MSHIARTLTAVVFMLSLVCLTMPGRAAGAGPCTIVYVYHNTTPHFAVDLANGSPNAQVTYDAQTGTATVTVQTNTPGCSGSRTVNDSQGRGSPYWGAVDYFTRRNSGGTSGGSQTGTSATQQTTGGGSTAPKYPKGHPATQTAPSGSGTLK